MALTHLKRWSISFTVDNSNARVNKIQFQKKKNPKVGTYTVGEAMGKPAFSHIADRNAKYINLSGEEFDTIRHNTIVFNF